jgi:peptidoglycan/LPS O-acetylase OafA/YrhL
MTLFFIPITIASYIVSTILYSFLESHGWAPYLPWFFARIPVFLLGMIIAEHEDVIRKRINMSATAILITVSFLAFLLLELHAMSITKILSFPCDTFWLMACSLPFIFFICSIMQRHVKIFNPFILFCGRYSLEIYLLHVAFITIVIRSGLFEGLNSNYTFGGAMVFSFPCAWLLNRALSKVTN